MKIGVLIAIIIICIVALFFLLYRGGIRFSTLKVRDKTIRVEVVDTPASRAQGLSGRVSLPENQGMYFVFEFPAKHGFWMKDMRFPIDIIWIKDGAIIGFQENTPVPTGGELPVYYPQSSVSHVLEINAFKAKEWGFRIGDKVEILP
jgi:uncharacterized protein